MWGHPRDAAMAAAVAGPPTLAFEAVRTTCRQHNHSDSTTTQTAQPPRQHNHSVSRFGHLQKHLYAVTDLEMM